VIIGLTGSIGSGKTYIANCFRSHGAVIINADQIARDAISPHTNGFKKVVGKFGQGILNSDGEIDRSHLAKIVFANPEKKELLESIIHPIVRQREEELIRQYETEYDIIILEIPLLFETGAEELCDKVVVVKLDDDIRFKRLQETRSMTVEQIKSRLATQMSQEEKIKRADYVIDNSGTKEQSAAQVADLITELKKN